MSDLTDLFEADEAPEERTPEEWAVTCGYLAPPAVDGSRFRAPHAAAAAAHWWDYHTYHHGTWTLTRDDYDRAVAAAAAGKRHGPANRRPTK